eukprot:TRINITY_DN27570_c0_g1_i1.p1 TRINITY_DN27570_c0_g1~~TRINITY_DN27570_c0_g1_i1.p1  ORF type:complete len:216 (+),score=21.49 TRINITY_DN27570_c0_g1_i1:53-649(+)
MTLGRNADPKAFTVQWLACPGGKLQQQMRSVPFVKHRRVPQVSVGQQHHPVQFSSNSLIQPSSEKSGNIEVVITPDAIMQETDCCVQVAEEVAIHLSVIQGYVDFERRRREEKITLPVKQLKAQDGRRGGTEACARVASRDMPPSFHETHVEARSPKAGVPHNVSPTHKSRHGLANMLTFGREIGDPTDAGFCSVHVR